MTTAAIYTRISDDRRGDGEGVARQRQDCETLVKARGWSLASTFTDNDLSAYSGKPRPAYAALMAAVKAGRVGAVVAWHPDRLHRSPRELEDFISLIEQKHVRVETVQAGQWDLASPGGRLVARQLGSVARYESEHKSSRVRRALEQNAESGRAHGRRAYGWDRIHDTVTGRSREIVNVAEAKIVAEIADRILAGDSIRHITATLNERAIPSPAGKPWSKGMVRAVVTRQRNVGLRVHHGEIAGDGAWEPILTVAVWEQLRAVLADPRRKTSTSSAAAHLLSGIARCGVCGGPIRAGRNRTVDSYRCADHSCVSRARASVDDLVTRVIVARLSRPDAVALLAPPDRSTAAQEAADEARTLRARLDNVADDYADGKIDRRQLERITARIRPQIDDAQNRARAVDDTPLLDGLLGAKDVAGAWDALPLTQRRALVDLLIEVTIMRAEQGARTFAPASVKIKWRG